MSLRLEGLLDQMHSNRDAGVALFQRIPVYLEAAKVSAMTDGVRSQSINFVGLAVKATATGIYESAVKQLEKAEPKIIEIIDKTGGILVRGINKIGSKKN